MARSVQNICTKNY